MELGVDCGVIETELEDIRPVKGKTHSTKQGMKYKPYWLKDQDTKNLCINYCNQETHMVKGKVLIYLKYKDAPKENINTRNLLSYDNQAFP